MKHIYSKSKATRNYFVAIILFLPFILLLITGVVMLVYHTGRPYSILTIGLNGDTWLAIHKVLTIITIPLILLHLGLHYKSLIKLFPLSLNNKYKGKSTALFIFFLLCSLTSLLSWFVFTDSAIGEALKGIHNKLGIVLIVFFIIHIRNYFKWIISMTRRIFIGKDSI